MLEGATRLGQSLKLGFCLANRATRNRRLLPTGERCADTGLDRTCGEQTGRSSGGSGPGYCSDVSQSVGRCAASRQGVSMARCDRAIGASIVGESADKPMGETGSYQRNLLSTAHSVEWGIFKVANRCLTIAKPYSGELRVASGRSDG